MVVNNNSSRISTLDLVRGMAAFAVCAGHLRAAIFLDYSQISTHSILQKLFYALTSLGHEAVVIFFVLSGFFVGGSILKQKNQFDWMNYSISRIVRLWVVLIPALLFTLIVDQIIQLLHPEILSGVLYKTWSSGPDATINYSRSLAVFIGNVFFQQTIFVPVYGTNSPLWSLSNEFFYYFLFPVFLLFVAHIVIRRNFFLRFFLVVSGAIALSFLPGSFAEGFFIFCSGALVWFVMNYKNWGRQVSQYWMIAGVSIFLISIYCSKMGMKFVWVGGDILIGIGFSLFLVSLTNSQLPSNLFRRFAAFIADISYSLYLTHFPVVLLIASTFYGKNQIKPDMAGMGQFFAWLLLIFLVAFASWVMFERHTDMVKKEILNRFMYRKKWDEAPE